MKRFFFSNAFFPFFSTMFLGAFNDNIFRYALSIFIVYQCGYSAERASALTFAATALLMLPQFPFSPLAGELADKHPQQKLFRWIKLVEIILMVATLGAFRLKNVPLLLILLFFMGTQSAFFSPLKYAYIRRNTPEELVRGNAYVSAGTYLAILGGMMLGIASIQGSHGTLLTGLILVVVAVAGYFSSRKIGTLPPADPDLKIHWDPLTGCRILLHDILRNKTLSKCVIGLSIFWMAGALYVSQLAGFCRHILNAREELVIVFTLLFSIGVALGACIAAVYHKYFNALRAITPALLLMAFFTADLFFAATSWERNSETLIGLLEIIRIPRFWRVTADLILLAACGGFYFVPLSALMQKLADARALARAVAANNILNAIAITAGSILTGALVSSHVISIEGVFLLIAGLNVCAACYLFPLRNTQKL